MKLDRHLNDNLCGKECFREVITQVITEEDYREVANFKQDLDKTYKHISCTN